MPLEAPAATHSRAIRHVSADEAPAIIVTRTTGDLPGRFHEASRGPAGLKPSQRSSSQIFVPAAFYRALRN